jgi:hypothetical protein
VVEVVVLDVVVVGAAVVEVVVTGGELVVVVAVGQPALTTTDLHDDCSSSCRMSRFATLRAHRAYAL